MTWQWAMIICTAIVCAVAWLIALMYMATRDDRKDTG